jgi:AraC-like DNA-binding protein
MVVHFSGRAQILRYTCMTGVADVRGTCRHSAARAGFSDQSQLCHHFKRLVDVAPERFRTPARFT